MADWFRNSDWNDQIEAAFFAKLNRARSQRDQYLVLQAHHLSDSHPQVTLRLIDLYFETRTDDFDDDRARRAVSAAQFALGGYKAALDTYLRILSGDESERDMYVGSPIEFAFLAARYRSADHHAAALEHLSEIEAPEAPDFDGRFRYLAAQALILADTGRDPHRAKRCATQALQVPDVVSEQYADVVWRLRGITRA